MPKANTHIMIANKAMEKLPTAPRAVIFANMQHYYLGSVFPDVLWFESSCRPIAEKIHGLRGEKTSTVVFEMLEKCNNDKQLAFILGYISHMAADITMHPMIISKTKEHNFLETQIDKIVNDSFYVHQVVYVRLLDELDFGAFVLPKNKIKVALKRMIALNRRLKGGFYYYAAVLANRFKKVDLGVFYHHDGKMPDLDSYKDPLTGKTVKKNLDQLVSAAISLSVIMIQGAYDYNKKFISKRSCERIITGKSLFSGQEGVPKSKLKVYG